MRYWEGDVTPKRAQELLDANEKNRKLPVYNLKRYTRAMLEGHWHFTGDVIHVGKSGNLLNGQTRLSAIVASNTTQHMAIQYDVPDHLQTYMDNGRSRSPADVFTMNEIPHPTTAASICRMLILYRRVNILDNSVQLDNDELLKFYEENSLGILEATKRGHEMRNKLGLNPSVAGTVFFLAREIADLYDVNWFFERLVDGNFMTPGNPIGVFRNFVQRRQMQKATRDLDGRISRTEYLWYLMSTWNHWARGESVTRLQLPKGGLYDSAQFPKLKPILPGVIPEQAHPEYYQPKEESLVITEGGAGNNG